MSAQAEGAAQLVNGVGPAQSTRSVDVPERPAPEPAIQPNVTTMTEPALDAPEVPFTARPSGVGDESATQQGRSQGLATTGMLDGDRRGEGAQHAVQGGAPRAADFLTPRSSMTTTVQPQNNWMNALEVPRWVSRLGSYLATGRGELAPSPLAGSVISSPSPPGGQAFRLRSPIRAGRPAPPPTPPSSEISAEAIQAEVQRQLGGLLNRLQVAETRNDALMSELAEARRGLESMRETAASVERVPEGRDDAGALLDHLGRAQGFSFQGGLGLPEGSVFIEPGRDPRGLPLREPEQRAPTRLLGDLATAPAGPTVSPEFSQPQAPGFGATETEPQPPPLPEPRGFMRSLLGQPRPRSETPPPRGATGGPQGDSPVMDAVLKGVQQLQELQAAALSRSQAPAAEVIKPGTTSLPALPEMVQGAETAMKFQDWLELTTAVMCDVSEQSGTWWRQVLEEVERAYKTWLSCTPLERLAVQPKGEELSANRWVRLNARVSAMILAAMSTEQQTDMVSHRISTSTVQMLYRLHTLYQPGGGHEREDILRKLQNPAESMASNTLTEVLRVLRAWPRWMARCTSLQMVPPDASVLARGLKLLTTSYLDQSPDASFRTAMVRTSLRLDGQPRMQDVYSYQRHLQAEVENMLATRPATSTITTPTATDGPKLRALTQGDRDKDKNKGKDKEKGERSAELCRYFMKPTGCKRGSRCTFSHSMTTLDKEARNRKCLSCGAESHRAKDCPIGKQARTTSTSTPTSPKEQRGQRPEVPSVATMSTATPGSTVDSTSSGTVCGTPWTLENLIQAAQQVVQSQGHQSGDSSPEKTKAELRTLVVRDVRISSMSTASAALLDSGATHCLRNAYDDQEWNRSESVMVQLAGNNKLVMKLSDSGSLLMPPRATSVTTTEGAGGGQTIVPMGELVRTLGYTLIWGPGECYLEDGDGTRTPLNVSTGCPQLCEAAALALISKLEDKKRERLENETVTTLDAVNLAALNMDKSWWDYVREYAESGNKEAALRGLRDAPFLQGLPGECLGGLVPEDVKDAGWSLMKKVDFLTRAQKRRMWTAKRWIVHLYAGNPGHYQMFQLDEGDTMVIELDLDRNKAHDVLRDSTWRMLMWGALNGRIDAIVGGPPGRAGLPGQDCRPSRQDVRNISLIARMFWLYSVAEAARTTSSTPTHNRQRPVAFVLEHPSEDSRRSSGSSMALWSLRLWKDFEDSMGMKRVTFDQKSTGASATSRTTLGTNVYYLMGLSDLAGEEHNEEAREGNGSIVEWSPGLVQAIVMALRFWKRTPKQIPGLAAMSATQWREHVNSGHAKYQRECLTCVMSRGTGKRHGRVRHPDTFTLTTDVAGPIKPGLDTTSKGTMGKGLRYFLVGKYTLPREFVKSYSGKDPPKDDGMGSSEQTASSARPSGKELVGPSLLPPREDGETGEEEQTASSARPSGKELVGPSLLPPREDGETGEEEQTASSAKPSGEELVGPSLLPPREDGETGEEEQTASSAKPSGEELVGPSLLPPREDGDPFIFDEDEPGEQGRIFSDEDEPGEQGHKNEHVHVLMDGQREFIGSTMAQREEYKDYEDSLYAPSEVDGEVHEEDKGAEDLETARVIQDCEPPEIATLLFAKPLKDNGLYVNKDGYPGYCPLP